MQYEVTLIFCTEVPIHVSKNNELRKWAMNGQLYIIKMNFKKNLIIIKKLSK